MGYPITSIDDYINEYAISTNKYDKAELSNYINRYEKLFLIELFGAELELNIINDLDVNNNPVTPRYVALWDEFYKDYKDELLISEGVKEILKAVIYFHYNRDQKNKNTITGNVVNQNSVSRESRLAETNISRLYNNAIRSYKTIQKYIQDNPEGYVYEEFNGKDKEYLTII